MNVMINKSRNSQVASATARKLLTAEVDKDSTTTLVNVK
jgi:hypothetical protein